MNVHAVDLLATDFEIYNLTKMELKIVLDRYKYELRQYQSKYIQSDNMNLELKNRYIDISEKYQELIVKNDILMRELHEIKNKKLTLKQRILGK